MHVLLTSAHGFVGSRITPLLLSSGHTITGLARSSESVSKLESRGVSPLQLSLEQSEEISSWIKSSHVDAVIHTAFNHDFSKYEEGIATDLAVIKSIGKALEGTNKPFIATFILSAKSEDQASPSASPYPRGQSEEAMLDLVDKGVKAMIIRLPTSVHGPMDKVFVPMLIQAAKEKKVSAYVDGAGEWSAVHVEDAAQLYADVLSKGKAGHRYHAIAENVVKYQDIAEAIGSGLGLEVKGVSQDKVADYVGPFLANFVGAAYAGEAEITKRELGWVPRKKGLIEDIKTGDYLN